MQEHTDELPIGSTVGHGRYEIKKVLGVGGFAITYRALDSRLGVDVAIKEYFPDGSTRTPDGVHLTSRLRSNSVGTTHFLAEARTLAKLSERRHPGIVRATDYFEDNGTAYLVMELIVGPTLEHLLERGALPVEEIETIGRSIGLALSEVHHHRTEDGSFYLHQDVSPSNIVRTLDSTPRYVLLDFGAARAFAAEQTGNMTAIVKPGYSPLEQYASRSQRGPQTDLYALGATLFHLATGFQPAEATVRAGTKDQLVPPVRSLRPQLSESVANAIDLSLRMDPMNRPESANEFVRLLDGGVSRVRSNDRLPSSPTVLIANSQTQNSFPEPTSFPESGKSAGRPKAGRTPAVLGIVTIFALLAGIAWLLVSRSPTENVAVVDSSAAVDTTRPAPLNSTSIVPPSTTESPVTTSMAPQVTIPMVRGSSQSGATALLADLGLRVSKKYDFSLEIAEGFVIHQTPNPGATGSPGDMVTILVSNGPPPGPEPDPGFVPDPEPDPAPERVSGEDFIRGYYALVNAGDYGNAWDYLSASYQREVGSYNTYVSFWVGKRAVEVYGFGRCQFGGTCEFRQRGSSKLFRLVLNSDPSNPKITGNRTK